MPVWSKRQKPVAENFKSEFLGVCSDSGISLVQKAQKAQAESHGRCSFSLHIMAEEETKDVPAAEEAAVSAAPAPSVAAPAQVKLPFIIVTGFLGAGKTTMLRHVLGNAGKRRVGLVENEVRAGGAFAARPR